MIGTCKHCEHSRRTTQMGVTALYCHINAPTTFLAPNGQGGMAMLGLWPPVEDGERCSKFEADSQPQRIPRSAQS